MTTKSPHANAEQLQLLLYGDESLGDLAEISSHVESCEGCQTRLQELAASEEEIAEVCQLLSGLQISSGASGPRSSATSSAGSSSDQHAREYLNPPSHPEMLGRLGRYEIECEIGSGGMGVVFKAFDAELRRPVAIKVLARHLARSGAARQRFGRESRAAAAIVHEHVVAIQNVESNGETPFLVMQFVAGESLQARVDHSGPLSVPEILRIGMQTAAGLAAAHEQGIVHRDIKPANILLEHGVERVLLTDFGLARTVDDASLTQTGIVAGTPHYMSPEQANGDETDHRTDLFSLGSVLYFVATGHPPFRAERAMGILHRICHDRQRPLWQVNPQIPDELSDIVERLLEKRPARRFDSATEVRDALLRLLNTIQHPRRSIRSRLRGWRRRHPRMIKAALATAMAIVVITSAAWFLPLAQPDLQRPVSATVGGPGAVSKRSESPQNAPTPSAQTKPATEPTPAAPHVVPLSVEILAEITPNERAKFTRSLDQVSEQLRSLETIHHGTFSQALSKSLQSETQSILLRLDQLQPVTTDSPRP